MVKPYPRYFELIEKGGMFFGPSNCREVLREFLPEDFRDLQVLANLVWIDPLFRDQKLISDLFIKCRNYTDFYEWTHTGFFDLTMHFSAMHKISDSLKRVYFWL
jgi:hypothetical protein